MGRPPHWFIELVLSRLSDLNYRIEGSFDSVVQADSIIMQQAKMYTGGKVFVVANDYDFIALAPKGAVHALLDIRWGKVIHVKDALAQLNLTHEQLFVAYCASGCDDIQTKIRGIGFKTAKRDVLKVQQNSVKNILNSLSETYAPVKTKILDLYSSINNCTTSLRTCKIRFRRIL